MYSEELKQDKLNSKVKPSNHFRIDACACAFDAWGVNGFDFSFIPKEIDHTTNSLISSSTID